MKLRNTVILIILFCLSSAFVEEEKIAWDDAAAYTSQINLVGGFILVEASVNGQSGTFILDTGAPGLILNARYFEGRKQHDLQAHALSDEVAVTETSVKHFEWLQVRKKHLKAYVLDLSNLEERTDRPILGLIGYELLKRQELFIDYENKIVQLFPSRRSPIKDHYDTRLEVPLHLAGHLPTVKMKVNGRQFKLGIDSGAETNIFHLKRTRKFKQSGFDLLGLHEVRGLDKKIRKVPVVRFNSTSVQKESMDELPFLLMNMDGLSNSNIPAIDGLLGYPFLKSGKVSINYGKGRLSFYE